MEMKRKKLSFSDGPHSAGQPDPHPDPEEGGFDRGRRPPLGRSGLRRRSLHFRQPPEGTTRSRAV